jgi:hypothetical protein
MFESENSFEDSEFGVAALHKAKELFAACDTEDKGFIIKRDMQRLRTSLPDLTPDQLEEVFDSLDQNKNGYLSPEEFVRGFGAHVHVCAACSSVCAQARFSVCNCLLTMSQLQARHCPMTTSIMMMMAFLSSLSRVSVAMMLSQSACTRTHMRHCCLVNRHCEHCTHV